MSTSRHRQSAKQWNPPPLDPDTPLPFDSAPAVASATECTGLAQHPAMNPGECADYKALQGTLPLKPLGNPGKGNPQNNPAEIAFHRGSEDSSK